jgi:hypothetical protein
MGLVIMFCNSRARRGHAQAFLRKIARRPLLSLTQGENIFVFGLVWEGSVWLEMELRRSPTVPNDFSDVAKPLETVTDSSGGDPPG